MSSLFVFRMPARGKRPKIPYAVRDPYRTALSQIDRNSQKRLASEDFFPSIRV